MRQTLGPRCHKLNPLLPHPTSPRTMCTLLHGWEYILLMVWQPGLHRHKLLAKEALHGRSPRKISKEVHQRRSPRKYTKEDLGGSAPKKISKEVHQGSAQGSALRSNKYSHTQVGHKAKRIQGLHYEHRPKPHPSKGCTTSTVRSQTHPRAALRAPFEAKPIQRAALCANVRREHNSMDMVATMPEAAVGGARGLPNESSLKVL
jgi:hypothetical protein